MAFVNLTHCSLYESTLHAAQSALPPSLADHGRCSLLAAADVHERATIAVAIAVTFAVAERSPPTDKLRCLRRLQYQLSRDTSVSLWSINFISYPLQVHSRTWPPAATLHLT